MDTNCSPGRKLQEPIVPVGVEPSELRKEGLYGASRACRDRALVSSDWSLRGSLHPSGDDPWRGASPGKPVSLEADGVSRAGLPESEVRRDGMSPGG